MTSSPVLIVGAGPTGLMLALWLTRRGVPVRLIDRSSGPGQASRAMIVHARTLEFYRQLGFAQETVARGIPVRAIHLREGNEEAAVFRIGDFGEGISPYPYLLSFPQDDHEKLLGEYLNAAGVTIEWNTELLRFADNGERVLAILQQNGAEETVETPYLCGCDGASSAVRHGLNLAFSGGTYEQRFFVADVRATGDAVNGDFNFCLGTDAFCAVFPIRSMDRQRLIGIVPDAMDGVPGPDFSDLQAEIEKLVGIQVQQVNWFSTYRVHHRVADHFQHGRVFIAGDAGHIHSPAGGQGLNTGIGDAVNLGWKLASVLQGQAAPSLLDTYEPERIAFAHLLVDSTDRAFRMMVGRNTGSQILRTMLLPHLASFLLGFSGVRRAAFRLISQTRIHYHESPLSHGSAGDIHGGDRLPWVMGTNEDNFVPLTALDWQVHVYGTVFAALRETAARHRLPIHEFPWGASVEAAGLEKDAAYLIRPDGYVALALPEQETDVLETYLSRWKLTMS
jgi:2-polyprenyl-6-methoxyphenol hydroxylase-like FAD-dependent oxidoreductase